VVNARDHCQAKASHRSSPIHTSNNVEATGNTVEVGFDFVEATFDIVERIVKPVALDNVAWTLLLVWTGLNYTAPRPYSRQATTRRTPSRFYFVNGP